jgi:hypothetical protein
MGLGIGLASRTRGAGALIESNPISCAGYRVEATDDESWKRKKYKRKHGWLPPLELSFAFYFVLAIGYAIRMHMGPDRIPVAVLLWLRIYGHDEFAADSGRQPSRFALTRIACAEQLISLRPLRDPRFRHRSTPPKST